MKSSSVREFKRRLSLVIAYALAMAWVESALVFYLRTMFNRLIPYQPDPLPIHTKIALPEIIREAATLVMLGIVGCLAGKTWRGRLAYSLIAFGVWDIAYYLWLIPLTGWPTSLLDWDVLFLIPLPWWGPVLAPVSIALMLIAFGVIVARHDDQAVPIWPSRRSLVLWWFGAGLALYTFMTDSISVVWQQNIAALSKMLPATFNWPVFLLGMALMSAPLWEVWRNNRRAKAAAPGDTLNANAEIA